MQILMFLLVKIARCKNITNKSTGELIFANFHAALMRFFETLTAGKDSKS